MVQAHWPPMQLQRLQSSILASPSLHMGKGRLGTHVADMHDWLGFDVLHVPCWASQWVEEEHLASMQGSATHSATG
mgnify:CR=1 FL=1